MTKNNNNSKRNNKAVKQIKKQLAREVGVKIAATYMGEQNARLAYKAGAKTAKVVARTIRKKQTPSVSSMAASMGKMKLFSQPTSRGLVLSQPSLNYLKSYVNPFDLSVKSVGLPRPGSMPSYKVTGFVRGVGQIGTKGVGFVWFAPCLANDRACVGYSHVDYAQTFIGGLPTDAYTANSAFSPANVNMSNLPYTANSLLVATSNSASIVEGRIVSSSFRVYYTGTTLNQSGQFYAYADPNMDSVVGSGHLNTAAQTTYYTIADLGNKDATEIVGAGRQDSRLVFIPPLNNFNDYPASNQSEVRKLFPYANAVTAGVAGSSGAANGVIAITGVAGQPFYFECITHAEYVGPGVAQALLTPSYSDTIGFDAVQMLLSRAQRRCASDARVTLAQCIQREAAAEGIKI